MTTRAVQVEPVQQLQQEVEGGLAAGYRICETVDQLPPPPQPLLALTSIGGAEELSSPRASKPGPAYLSRV